MKAFQTGNYTGSDDELPKGLLGYVGDEDSVPSFPFPAGLQSMYQKAELDEKVRKVLTADMWARKVRKWPLVLQKPRAASVINPRVGPPTYAYMGMFEDFEFLEMIIQKYPGELCVAGGAVTNHLFFGRYRDDWSTRALSNRRDADIFFYGVTEQRATEILEDCIAMLCSATNYIGYDANLPPDTPVAYRQVRVERNVKYVNVAFSRIATLAGGVHQTYRTYQFVLRIYPTFDSIIGAFDVPACSFAWDGANFYGTEIATWCMENAILIANISRRSPSFSYRLVKYCTRFGLKLFFPGLSDEFYARITMKGNNENLKKDLAAAFEKNNFSIYDPDGDSPAVWLEYVSNEVAHDKACAVFHRIVFNRDFSVAMYRGTLTELQAMSKEQVERVSDYSHTQVGNGRVRRANSAACAMNNPDAVIVCQVYKEGEVDRKTIVNDFRRLVEKPNVTVLGVDDLCTRFKHVKTRVGDPLFITLTATIVKTTGNGKADVSQQAYEAMVRTHNKAAKTAARNLRGLQWITKNADAQWTASHHPIHASAHEFYGDYYRSFEVGIPWPTLKVLLVGRKEKGHYFNIMDQYLFRLLLTYVLRAYSF
jgi:hypothetical protein